MEIEEGFLRVIDLQSGRLNYSSSWVTLFSTEVKRLSIYLGDLEDLDNYVPPRHREARHLLKVSFFLQNYFPRSRISRIVESHLSDFKLVRILDLGVFSSSSNMVPKKLDPIGKKTTKAERMVKQHATPNVGVVIRKPTFSSSSTTTLSNTKQEHVLNGKAPITEASSESSEDDK
ncbi:hypothetical protein LguiA_001386 [Lonicera macranthoides]